MNVHVEMIKQKKHIRKGKLVKIISSSYKKSFAYFRTISKIKDTGLEKHSGHCIIISYQKIKYESITIFAITVVKPHKYADSV